MAAPLQAQGPTCYGPLAASPAPKRPISLKTRRALMAYMMNDWDKPAGSLLFLILATGIFVSRLGSDDLSSMNSLRSEAKQGAVAVSSFYKPAGDEAAPLPSNLSLPDRDNPLAPDDLRDAVASLSAAGWPKHAARSAAFAGPSGRLRAYAPRPPPRSKRPVALCPAKPPRASYRKTAPPSSPQKTSAARFLKSPPRLPRGTLQPRQAAPPCRRFQLPPSVFFPAPRAAGRAHTAAAPQPPTRPLFPVKPRRANVKPGRLRGIGCGPPCSRGCWAASP